MIGIETTIKILTTCALAGLLGAVGLRLTWHEVKAALKQCRFTAILLVNFIVIPGLAVVIASGFGLKREVAAAMVLLAAAPFAPVVPVFARMARSDLALAAGLTAVFPVASALLTPPAVQVALRLLAGADNLHFNLLTSLAVLTATITLPLAAGVWVRHRAPNLGQRLLRPVEVISEAVGAISLAFVVVVEFGSIVNLGWRAWLAMALLSEISMVLGWKLGGPARGTRQVVALGTSNRNIALALLVAIENFPRTEVVSGVVGNGLLLIVFGLLHVGWWRLRERRRQRAEGGRQNEEATRRW